ncbi:MAG: hypothetical protein AABW79_04580 [Nanoarchaeota archaeon]
MTKKDKIKNLVVFLSLALAHSIGSIVNSGDMYADKYKKESQNYLIQAEKLALDYNWNTQDKAEIKALLKKRLHDELSKRTFLNERKFQLIDKEIDKTLVSLFSGQQ